jgi:hypothetical protein
MQHCTASQPRIHNTVLLEELFGGRIILSGFVTVTVTGLVYPRPVPLGQLKGNLYVDSRHTIEEIQRNSECCISVICEEVLRCVSAHKMQEVRCIVFC